MTRRPGYSEFENPNPQQIAAFEDGLKSGELARTIFVNDELGALTAVQYRRNHRFTGEQRLAAALAVALAIEPFQPGPTDPADRLVPRRVTPAEATTACQAAAALEPDYTRENMPEPVNWPAMITLWILASMAGAILAIAYQTWKQS